MATPNRHGVIPRDQCEVLRLVEHDAYCHLEILLARCADGWLWGYDWAAGASCVHGGGGGGWPSINRLHDGDYYKTRTAALRAAKRHLRKWLRVKPYHQGRVRADRQRLLAALGEVTVQLDLFGLRELETDDEHPCM